MASILDAQVQEVLSDKRAAQYNVPRSQRTYFEILSDPETGDLIRQDVVESFIKNFIKTPPVQEQEVRAIGTTDPLYVPQGAPAGGLQPGETVRPDGSISYDPALEATQSYDLDITLSSLAGGKMTPEGVFLAGPSRPGSPVIGFTLPPGMRPDSITKPVWKFMIKEARKRAKKEFQAAWEYDSALTSGAIAAAREVALGIPAVADMPGLVLRAADYIFSPVGTNTLGQDVEQGARKLLDLPDTRPRPSSPYLETYSRLGERGGFYSTENPNAWFEPSIVIQPDRELMPIYGAFGTLLDEVLINMGAPGILTAQQDNDAQKMAVFIGSVMGLSLSASGAFRAGAKLAVKGMKLEDLQKKGVLTRALYSLANSPGPTIWAGKAGRRFNVPGWIPFVLKDQGFALTSAGAMLITPDEAGPVGKVMAGLTAPFALSKALSLVRGSATGQALSMVGGFLEPFTVSGQRVLATRNLADTVPKGSEGLVRTLLSDLDNVPQKVGQDELVTTPAYFDAVSQNLRQAEADWKVLNERGVSPSDAIEQLSQNPVYGRYFKEVSVFGDAAPTLEGLFAARMATKVVSDNLYGAMAWLQTGSPIQNEVLRSTGERLRRAEEAFKDLARNFEGNPADAQKYIQSTIEKLDDLARDSMQTHAVDAALYIQLKKRLEDAGGPTGVMKNAANESKVAVAAIRNSLKEMREIERVFWREIGADSIEISPQNMALIGDKAAEIILSTPVAQRNQIPPIFYQLAGRNRLLSESALESMASAAGAAQDVPANIRNARARLSQLNAELDKIPVSEVKRIGRKEEQIAGQQAKLDSLEGDLIPVRTSEDEFIVTGPNGILDSVNTLDEVTATRTVLLDAKSKADARIGGKNAARLSNLLQKYIIEDWLQNPAIFGDVGKTAAYDAARQFSIRVNDLYTRNDSILTKFMSQDPTRAPKTAPETFLAKIIEDNKVDPRNRPTGSLDALDVALVEAKAPFLKRGDDGVIVVDRNAGLTPGLENITWESIRTTGGEKLSTSLIKEELLNQLALIAFDANGIYQPATVQRAIRSWDAPISKVESEFPNFRSELKTLIDTGEELAARSKALETMTKREADMALATQSLDDIKGAQAAGILTRKVQGDHSNAQLFLENDPNVVARELLNNPQNFETNVKQIVALLDTDKSGRAKAGFQRAFFNELLKQTSRTPEKAGRMAGEAVLDPAKINSILTENETALRTIFDDFVGPPGSNMTTYDELKMFNDSMSATMAELAGTTAGTAPQALKATWRGQEFIRNMGRIAGVRLAGMTGGPALVMAGTGGRLAGKIYEHGNMGAVYSLVADALADPSKAKLMLVDSASLTKKGRFNFDRKLADAVIPYLFYAGRPTSVAKVGVEQQREIDRIEREGGPTEIIYDGATNQYIRRPVERVDGRWVPTRPDVPPYRSGSQRRKETIRGIRYEELDEAVPGPQTSVPPARPRSRRAATTPIGSPIGSSILSQTNILGPPPPAQGQASLQGTRERGQQVFGPLDRVFANKGGIVSIKRKPRQLVG